jgi:hypothetical protein
MHFGLVLRQPTNCMRIFKSPVGVVLLVRVLCPSVTPVRVLSEDVRRADIRVQSEWNPSCVRAKPPPLVKYLKVVLRRLLAPDPLLF